MSSAPAAAAYAIEKRFAGVHALRGVTIEFEPHSVHCLVGENGAGKSTLVKVLSGTHRPDSGQVHIGGHVVSLRSPHEALQLGVRTIYQEQALVGSMSVAENIALGYGPTLRAPGFRNRRRLRALAEEALARLGISGVDPDAPVETLGVARQQQLEIAKAVSRPGGRLVIMDEPTAPLTLQETEVLFDIVRRLRDDGLSILYVTHRLHEIAQIGDVVSVMRDGEMVWTGASDERNPDELVEAMVGRRIETLYPSRAVSAGDVALTITDRQAASAADDRTGSSPLRTLMVRRGEVVGVFGLVGAGRTEMIRALIGLDFDDRYEAALDGRQVLLRSPRDAMEHGMSVVPEDRKRAGIVPEMNVATNIALSSLDALGSGPWLRYGAMRAVAQRYVDGLAIKTPSLRQPIAYLSGGTQQKCIVARVLAHDPNVVVLDEPTRGIDVGARAELYALMNRLCEDGRALLMITSDVAEALGMADRIYVMRGGSFVGELPARGATQEDVVGLAVGSARGSMSIGGRKSTGGISRR